jgi:hypothetical protein
MGFSTSCDYRDNSRHAQFGAFFNCPLHAIEFEDGNSDCDVAGFGLRQNCAKFEFDTVVVQGGNHPAAEFAAGGDVEFLSDAGTENLSEVAGMVPDERCAIP